jgi:PAS domain-containing protein
VRNPSRRVRRNKGLVRRAVEIQAKAQRSMMKARAKHTRSLERIERTAERVRTSKRATADRPAPKRSGLRDPAWMDTDRDGRILDWSAGAAALTGYSERSLPGAALPAMFVEGGPDETELERVLLGHAREGSGLIRSRERPALPVTYRLELAPGSTDLSPRVRWTLRATA